MTTAATLPATQTFLEQIHALAENNMDLPVLNIDEIDSCCLQYDLAERALATAEANYKTCKSAVVALVQAQGHVPAGAEESKRIVGRRSVATITIAKATTVREQGVAELEKYLSSNGLEALFDALFATNVKHTLQKSAHDVLRSVQIRKPEAEKISGLFGKCIDVKPKSPSLKVESIVPEKPARTPRGKKAVA